MPIPEINQVEQWNLRSCVDERRGKDAVPFELVEVEARLDPSDRELTAFPGFFWESNDCHFVILKSGDKTYRSQFYYRNLDQYGTGMREYEDIDDCAIELLRLQADHESTGSEDFPGSEQH